MIIDELFFEKWTLGLSIKAKTTFLYYRVLIKLENSVN